MQDRWNDVWEASEEVYSERQIENIATKLEIDIVGETNTHFQCYCPFHDNTDSPAFVIDKRKGLWTCFNPSCAEAGTLEELVRRLKKCTPFGAQMLIVKCKTDDVESYEERKKRIERENTLEMPTFSQDKLDELYRNFKGSPAQTYMYGRGFEDETLDYFRIGYSPARQYPYYRPEMVTVPMHDFKGNPIGLIGRSIEGKRFKNSKNLPKRLTAWNIHRAKKTGESVIVVEASFDAMRIHQAGYPNVVALLGGHVTEHHLTQLDRYFSTIIIMTDFEQEDDMIKYPNCRKCSPELCRGHRPGRDLGHNIAKGLSHRKVLWAAYDDTCVYPHGAKDAGAMTDDEIRKCIKGAVRNFDYNRWGIES